MSGDVPQVCTVVDCGKPLKNKRHCSMHAERLRRTGSLELRPRTRCSNEGCEDASHARAMCRRHYKQWRAREHPEKDRAASKAWRERNADKIKADFSAWAAKNRSHLAEYQRNRRSENLEKERARVREYEKRPHVVAARKRYYEANRARLLAAKREYRQRNAAAIQAYQARWTEENRVRVNGYNNLRRARKRESQVSVITAEALDMRMSMWGHKCWICLAPYEHVDHVKPISLGGPHILANLRPSCQRCNQRKHNKWPYVP